jgi:hypothetical protein
MVSDLPDDAEIVGCYWAQEMQTAVFICQSDEFDPIPEGEVLPLRVVTFRTAEEEAA